MRVDQSEVHRAFLVRGCVLALAEQLLWQVGREARARALNAALDDMEEWLATGWQAALW